MDEDSLKYKSKFEHEVKSAVVGEKNIIYNYFYYVKNVRDKPVEPEETAAEEKLPCPYRGLFHFGPNDSKFFFGREVFVEELLKATQTRNFIPVLGASGSGKSSVILAGLVPKLQEKGHWKFTHFRPGDEPFHSLAKALVPLYEPHKNSTEHLEESRQLAQSFEQGSVPLKDVFAQIESLYSHTRVLLIADQFEELYTLCPKDKIRQSFLDLLLDSFQSSPSNLQFPPVLVITMRADFLGDALSYRPLADVLNSDIKLGAMNREELSQVIEKPAKSLGVEFESGLVERILDDVKNEPGNLALLEFSLTELWKEQTGNQLTHKAYEKIGQVKGALAEYAEQEYNNLKHNEKQQARQIFIQLVRLGENNNDTRRRVNRNQIGEDNWKLVTRKDGLADSRLVVTSFDNMGRETLELVHEALIRHWKRLRQWLDDNRDNLNKQQKIEDAAKEWESSGKKTDYLLSKKRLKESKDFQKEQQEKYPLSELAVSFVVQSSKHLINERIKFLALFSIVLIFGTAMGDSIVRAIELYFDKQLVENCQNQKSCSGIVDALERLVKAKENLSSYDLSNTNLESNTNLKGANLRNTILVNTSLRLVNLSGANLINADLSVADLSGADLSGARLIDADLSGADLSGANLMKADLSGADLSGARLIDAHLYHAKLIGAKLIKADFSWANLSWANLSGADLSGANFYGANLTNTYFNQNIRLDPNVIRLACFWNKANYKFIKDLSLAIKGIESDNPNKTVDCSKW